jgi:hypothetical protein
VECWRNQWAVFYYGLSIQDRKARDLLALGSLPDQLHKTDGVLVDAGPPGSIDDDFAHKPSVIGWNGDFYHFYTAVSGKYPNDIRGISVARCGRGYERDASARLSLLKPIAS